MKITIEPSADQTDEEYPYPKVSLEVPGDELNINDVGDLVRAALLAWGFGETSVDKLITIR